MPCGRVVFEPAVVTGYEIIGIDPGGHAEKAGLRLGDVLLTVNGTGAESDHFLAIVSGMATKESGALVTLRRAGREQELNVRVEGARPGFAGSLGMKAVPVLR